MNSNLFAHFQAAFPYDRSACAIESDAGYFSWDDIDRASAKIANLLVSLDLPAASRIAVQVEKSVENLLLYLAVLRAGHVYLPLNTAYQSAEMDYFIANAQPAVVVCVPQKLGWMMTLCERHGVRWQFTLGDQPRLSDPRSLLANAAVMPDHFKTVQSKAGDLAAILYTSGTTGRSKGAMLTHGNMLSNAQTLKTFWGWRADDVLLHALPIFHVHGLFVACHGALLAGAKMLWCKRFDATEVLALLPRATIFMGVPTMYVRLLAEPGLNAAACNNMRLFISGSAPLLTETHQQFSARTGHTILERYGMSETVMLTSNPCVGERRAGTVGVPLPGVSLRIMREDGSLCGIDEIGGIQVKGPNVFSGYWRMPEKTAEEFAGDGYFKTGDVGKRSADGYITIVGRSKDLIITGGYNVYPKEIEDYIDDIAGVAEAAVIGLPHPDFGEAVCAVVVPRAGATLQGDAIIAALKTQIASFKVPKRVWVVMELPRNTMGKVQKNLLCEAYRDTFAAP
jgi:malonyl-CoA/methylmalonyl-CoA synthetase